MIDRLDGGRGIGEELLTHAEILWVHWQRVRDGTRTRTRRRSARRHAVRLRKEVLALLERGTACGCLMAAGVCRESLAVEASLWTFEACAGVEPTNNAAERAVRWRRTSFGTNSERGSRFVERILTVVAT